MSKIEKTCLTLFYGIGLGYKRDAYRGKDRDLFFHTVVVGFLQFCWVIRKVK